MKTIVTQHTVLGTCNIGISIATIKAVTMHVLCSLAYAWQVTPLPGLFQWLLKKMSDNDTNCIESFLTKCKLFLVVTLLKICCAFHTQIL